MRIRRWWRNQDWQPLIFIGVIVLVLGLVFSLAIYGDTYSKSEIEDLYFADKLTQEHPALRPKFESYLYDGDGLLRWEFKEIMEDYQTGLEACE